MSSHGVAAAAAEEKSAVAAQKIRVEQHSGAGMVWFAGWLFTLGMLHPPFFWKGVLALLLWPYYLGAALQGLLR